MKIIFSGRKLLFFICFFLGCVTIQQQSLAQAQVNRWKSFNAVLHDNNVTLDWQIASEVNNPTFFVEHSIDGKTWMIIGTVLSKTDLGMIAKESFVHINPGPGVHQYRIRQESVSGSRINYSEIITVNIKSNGQLATWPNPATNTINIQSVKTNESTPLWAKFYDLSGNLVKQVDLRAGNNAVDISRLKPDIYVIQIRLPNGKNDNQKIIKQ